MGKVLQAEHCRGRAGRGVCTQIRQFWVFSLLTVLYETSYFPVIWDCFNSCCFQCCMLRRVFVLAWVGAGQLLKRLL